MKKTIFAEENRTHFQSLFNTGFSMPDEIAASETVEIRQNQTPESDSILDVILSFIKWIFLYIPGVAAIHMAMMGLAVMLFYGNFQMFGLLGFVGVGTFLIMLGFGKLGDLKYLKTVLMIVAASFLLAVVWDFLAVFIKGDFFGTYARWTFPIVAFVGYFSKQSVDNEAKEL